MRKEAAQSNEPHITLTTREQEIFTRLLEGAAPKELAHSLNITLNTFKTHQKNLYRKLDVNNIRQLIATYSTGPADYPHPQSKADKPVAFIRWWTNKDDLGSSVKITEKIEEIEGQYFPTITMAGKLAPTTHVYAGTFALPDSSTLEAMKKMKGFSFRVLGDGNSYAVLLPTTDTKLKSDHNHYRKLFTTQNGKISTVTVSINELIQSPFWGNPAPFIQDNIEFFQIHAHVTGKFNLKFWDIRFY